MQTLRNGLQLLSLIYRTNQGLTARELAQASGLRHRTLYLYLQILQDERYVARDAETKRYVAYYPHPGFSHPEPEPSSGNLLRKIAEEIYALTLHRVYVVTVRPWGLHLEVTVGRPGQPARLDGAKKGPVSAYAHASSAGQAILAHLPKPALWAHLERYSLQPFTPRTVTDPDVLQTRLREVRSRDFAITRGELSHRRCGLAVPLHTSSGQPLGAVSIGLPLRNPCVLEDLKNPRACRACFGYLPILRSVVEKTWQSSAT